MDTTKEVERSMTDLFNKLIHHGGLTPKAALISILKENISLCRALKLDYQQMSQTAWDETADKRG